MISDRQIAAVICATGMGRMQAYRHLQQRGELARRDRERRRHMPDHRE